VIIDCDSCEVRGLACGDCVVTALLGAPPGGMEIDDGERAAIDALAHSGLVPPLRLVLSLEPVDPARAGGGANAVDRTGDSAAAG
jgi:hypothetical protein